MRIRLALKFVFYFFGTFLHELAHYVAALLLGKAEGFSVIPRIEGKRFVLGHVRYTVRYKFLSSFIASAPLVWWAVLFLTLLYLRIIQINNGLPELSSEELMKRLKDISISDVFSLWVFVQLVWAGRLSGQDLKEAFKGMLSVSGLVFLSAVAILVFAVRTLCSHLVC